MTVKKEIIGTGFSPQSSILATKFSRDEKKQGQKQTEL